MTDHGFMRLYRADDAPADDNAPIVFVAATAGMKGDRVDLGVGGIPWDYSRAIGGGEGPRYPFLWVHDLAGRNLPLGVADVLTAPDELPTRVAVTFDPDDDLAMRARAKFVSPVGGLAGISVSWDDVGDDGVPVRATGKKVTARQILEFSAVPVGLDPNALKEGARADLAEHLRALRADLDAMLVDYVAGATPSRDGMTGTDEAGATPGGGVVDDATDGAKPDVGDVDGEMRTAAASAMLAAFDRETPDEDRRTRYNWACVMYRWLRLTPPDWIDGDELHALDDGNWRAIVSGELEVIGHCLRVGKELSSRNMEDIRAGLDAITKGAKTIGAVLDRAAGREPFPPQDGDAKGKTDDSEPKDSERAADEDEDAVVAHLALWLDEQLARRAGG